MVLTGIKLSLHTCFKKKRSCQKFIICSVFWFTRKKIQKNASCFFKLKFWCFIFFLVIEISEHVGIFSPVWKICNVKTTFWTWFISLLTEKYNITCCSVYFGMFFLLHTKQQNPQNLIKLSSSMKFHTWIKLNACSHFFNDHPGKIWKDECSMFALSGCLSSPVLVPYFSQETQIHTCLVTRSDFSTLHSSSVTKNIEMNENCECILKKLSSLLSYKGLDFHLLIC